MDLIYAFAAEMAFYGPDGKLTAHGILDGFQVGSLPATLKFTVVAKFVGTSLDAGSVVRMGVALVDSDARPVAFVDGDLSVPTEAHDDQPPVATVLFDFPPFQVLESGNYELWVVRMHDEMSLGTIPLRVSRV